MKRIESKHNKLLKYATSLQLKKYRSLYGEYLLEGYRCIYDMLDTVKISHILIEENRILSNEYAELIDMALSKEVVVHSIAKDVKHGLAGTYSSQGIWAIAPIITEKNPTYLKKLLLLRKILIYCLIVFKTQAI